MAKLSVAQADVDGWRAKALFYLARPNPRDGGYRPAYCSIGKIDGARLATELELDHETIAHALERRGGELPDDFLKEAASAAGVDQAFLYECGVKTALDEGCGCLSYADVVSGYIAAGVLRNKRRAIYDIIPADALDLCALEVGEEEIRAGESISSRPFELPVKVLAAEITHTGKGSRIWIGTVVDGNEDRRVKEGPYVADVTTELRPFLMNTFTAMRRNFERYCTNGGLAPEALIDLTKAMAHSQTWFK